MTKTSQFALLSLVVLFFGGSLQAPQNNMDAMTVDTIHALNRHDPSRAALKAAALRRGAQVLMLMAKYWTAATITAVITRRWGRLDRRCLRATGLITVAAIVTIFTAASGMRRAALDS